MIASLPQTEQIVLHGKTLKIEFKVVSKPVDYSICDNGKSTRVFYCHIHDLGDNQDKILAGGEELFIPILAGLILHAKQFSVSGTTVKPTLPSRRRKGEYDELCRRLHALT